MALINCSECGREISDKAAACPQCGCPVAKPDAVLRVSSRETEKRVRTIEKTGKQWKAFQLVGIILMIIGFISCIAELGQREMEEAEISGSEDKIDEVLLNGTIKAAKAQVFPPNDAIVSYNRKDKSIHVTFTTPKWYKAKFFPDVPISYLRWADNQWVVLQEFKRSGIPVSRVIVETNFMDGSGVMRFTHSAKHIDKYAKLPSDDLWLKTGTFHMRAIDSTKWREVPY